PPPPSIFPYPTLFRSQPKALSPQGSASKISAPAASPKPAAKAATFSPQPVTASPAPSPSPEPAAPTYKAAPAPSPSPKPAAPTTDRKSTRLNSSHVKI